MDTVTHTHDSTAISSGMKQPYHLVDPSPWPIVGALGAGLLLPAWCSPRITAITSCSSPASSWWP